MTTEKGAIAASGQINTQNGKSNTLKSAPSPEINTRQSGAYQQLTHQVYQSVHLIQDLVLIPRLLVFLDTP